MSFIKHYYTEDELMNEMLLKGKRKSGESQEIMAFNKWIYFLDDEAPDWEKTKQEIVANLNLEDKMDEDDLEGIDVTDLKQQVSEYVPDVLIGTVDDYNNLYVDSYVGFKLDPKSSILIKKVVKQLGIEDVEYARDDYGSETTSKYEIKGKIPDVAYHGTTSEYLDEISRIGLRPGAKESNWLAGAIKIEHPDKIFFSTRFDEAQGHAQMTAGKRGGYPMVVEFKIPDKDKMVADYDVEVQTGQHMDGDSDVTLYYTHMNKPTHGSEKTHKEKPFSVSKEFGIYGYKGAIPPKFIQSYWVAVGKEPEEVYGQDDYTEYDATDVKELKCELDPEYCEYEDEDDWDNEE